MAKISPRKRFSYYALALLVALPLLAAHPAAAATATGSSGLIHTPSADTLETGDVELGVRYTGNKLSASLTWGIAERIEIGVNSLEKGGTLSDLGLFVKGAVFEETADRPAVAVGFETGQSYVVVSKRLAPRVRAHAGYGSGALDGVFAGVSVALNTTSNRAGAPVTTVLAEATKHGLNAGLRMIFSPSISLDVALIDLEKFSGAVGIRMRF